MCVVVLDFDVPMSDVRWPASSPMTTEDAALRTQTQQPRIPICVFDLCRCTIDEAAALLLLNFLRRGVNKQKAVSKRE